MKRNEKADAAKATGAAVSEVACVVEDMHKAFADPIFSATAVRLGKAFGLDEKIDLDSAAEVRSNYGLRANIYRAVRGTSVLTGEGVAWMLGQLKEDPEAVSIHDTKRGATAISALNTAFGDNLKIRGSSLAPEMALKAHGHTVLPSQEDLAEAYPHADSTIVIFVHGLGATEYVWGATHESFGHHLHEEFGYTPLYVRYNTGANIYQNGADFALLTQLIYDNWPVKVDNITLIGHSMGGLVIRSACAQVVAALEESISAGTGLEDKQGDAWTDHVRQIFYIGSPHRGAPMERVANQAIGQMENFNRSRPLVPLLNKRSAGIKDLRFGTILVDELGEAATDPSSSHRDLAEHKDVMPLPGAEHHLIVGYKMSPSRGRAAEMLGDVIVPADSASAKSDGVNRSDFEGGQYHAVEGISHIPMMNNPQVYEVIRGEVARYASEGSDS